MEQNLKNKIANYKDIEKLYKTIRAHSYDAEHLTLPDNVYEKYKPQFLQYDVWLLQRFLNKLDVPIIPMHELIEIIRTQELSNLDIDYNAFSDDFL